MLYSRYDLIIIYFITTYTVKFLSIGTVRPEQSMQLQIRARGYETFFMLISVEHENFPAHNVKMPTLVGILTAMSMKNSILGLSEPEKS